MFPFFLCLFFMFMVAYPLYHLYLLISKIEKAKNYKSVTAIVKDARVLNVTSKISVMLFRSRCFFHAEAELNGVKIGYSNPTFYPFINAHQKQLVSALKPGDEIVMYYNPKAPYEGVMLKPSEHAMFWLIIRSVFFLMTVLVGMNYYFNW